MDAGPSVFVSVGAVGEARVIYVLTGHVSPRTSAVCWVLLCWYFSGFHTLLSLRGPMARQACMTALIMAAPCCAHLAAAHIPTLDFKASSGGPPVQIYDTAQDSLFHIFLAGSMASSLRCCCDAKASWQCMLCCLLRCKVRLQSTSTRAGDWRYSEGGRVRSER